MYVEVFVFAQAQNKKKRGLTLPGLINESAIWKAVHGYNLKVASLPQESAPSSREPCCLPVEHLTQCLTMMMPVC